MKRKRLTIAGYLLQRLEALGLTHMFGLPGDYVLGFLDQVADSRIQMINTCDEQGAGFAADGYARVHGIGALCITYCVGGLKTVNPVAGAYAEKSPLVVISGSPGMRERQGSPLLHHKVRDFHTQLHIYREITVAAAALEDPQTAASEIDRCLNACVRYKRPVYLELPRDLVQAPCSPSTVTFPEPSHSDSAALKEAVEEAAQMLKAARRPVVLAGVEMHRFGLQDALLKLVEHAGYPIAATLLGKSVIRENHEQYLGVYEGAIGHERTRRAVEGSDCVLILGAFMTDLNLGVGTARLEPRRSINATSETIAIQHHRYDHVLLGDFLSALTKRLPAARRRPRVSHNGQAQTTWRMLPGKPITVRRLFQRIDAFLQDDNVVISDIGDSLFGAADLHLHRRTEFLSPAYYTSMGFAVPAALGAQMARRNLRPLVFVGDGAFQMTGQELSTIARHGLNPIVFILNNKGYTTERFIHEGPYNDVHEWDYHLLPKVYRAGWGCEVRSEADLETALQQARANRDSFSLINIHLQPTDSSPALQRLGQRLGQRVRARHTADK